MRRLVVLLALIAAVPTAAQAQPRLMGGVGFTAPTGDISDAADPGYHVRAALRVGIPTTPLSLQADGTYHKLGTASATFADTQVLSGALSAVFTLPGIGMQPYVLGGLGTYRVKSGPVGVPVTSTETGYHGGFGVTLGGLGFGGFAELRFIQINGPVKTRLIPLTFGFRL